MATIDTWFYCCQEFYDSHFQDCQPNDTWMWQTF